MMEPKWRWVLVIRVRCPVSDGNLTLLISPTAILVASIYLGRGLRGEKIRFRVYDIERLADAKGHFSEPIYGECAKTVLDWRGKSLYRSSDKVYHFGREIYLASRDVSRDIENLGSCGRQTSREKQPH